MTLTHVDGEDLSNKDCEAVALLLLGIITRETKWQFLQGHALRAQRLHECPCTVIL